MSDQRFSVESIQIHNLLAEPPFKLTLSGKVVISGGTSLTVRVEPSEPVDGMTVDQLKEALINKAKSDIGIS